MKIAGIVLARMDSTRFPGKPLAQVGRKVLLDFVIERAHRILGLDSIVIATSSRAIDDPLEHFADGASTYCFRGAGENVANRALSCARQIGADYFVRLNGDSPYLLPELISEGLIKVRTEQPDLVSNIFPRTFPYGISLEIVNTTALARALPQFTVVESEHLTSHFYSNYQDFNILNISAATEYDTSARMVVDTPQDFETFCKVVSTMGENFSTATLPQILRHLVP